MGRRREDLDTKVIRDARKLVSYAHSATMALDRAERVIESPSFASKEGRGRGTSFVPVRVEDMFPVVDRKEVLAAEKKEALRYAGEGAVLGGNPFDVALTEKGPVILVKTGFPIYTKDGKIAVPLPRGGTLKYIYDANSTGKWIAYFLARAARKAGVKKILLAPSGRKPVWDDWETFREREREEIKQEYARRVVDLIMGKMIGRVLGRAARELGTVDPGYRSFFAGRRGPSEGLGRVALQIMREVLRLSEKHVEVHVNGMPFARLSFGDADPEKTWIERHVERLGRESAGGMIIAPGADDVIKACARKGYDPREVEKALERLMLAGYINYPRNGRGAIPPEEAEKLKSWGILPGDAEVMTEGSPGIFITRPDPPAGGVEREIYMTIRDMLSGPQELYRIHVMLRDSEGVVDEVEREELLPAGSEPRIEWFTSPPVSDIKPADILASVSAGTESTRGQIIERLVENGFLTRNLRLTTKGYIAFRVVNSLYPHRMDIDLNNARTMGDIESRVRRYLMKQLGVRSFSEVEMRRLGKRIKREIMEIISVDTANKLSASKLEEPEKWVLEKISQQGYVTLREFRVRWNLDKKYKLAGKGPETVFRAMKDVCENLAPYLRWVREGKENRVYLLPTGNNL